MPVPAGGFVRRVAHTPHYDGVKKGGKEPTVIGIFGEAPIMFKATDPCKAAGAGGIALLPLPRAGEGPGKGHASLQFIVGNFRELGQMTERACLERTIGVNRNR